MHVGNKSSGVSSPSQVPEKLRVTLIEFRALHEAVKVQYGTTKSQLSNVRQHLKQLSAECSTYREIVTARTSAITVSVHFVTVTYKVHVHVWIEMRHTLASTVAIDSFWTTLKAASYMYM